MAVDDAQSREAIALEQNLACTIYYAAESEVARASARGLAPAWPRAALEAILAMMAATRRTGARSSRTSGGPRVSRG